MNDNRTASILQRVSMVLAVTAASYGLPLQAHATRAAGPGFKQASTASQLQPACAPRERSAR